MSDNAPKSAKKRGSSAPIVSTGPSNATRSRGHTPVAPMEHDPMRKSNVPNAGKHGHLTKQPTSKSTSYGGAGHTSRLPDASPNPPARNESFEQSFTGPAGGSPGPGTGRGRGRGTPAGRGMSVGSGRGRGGTHPLSIINEHSSHGSSSASSAGGVGPAHQPNLNGAPSVSGHDIALPSIEGPDHTFQNETVGPITSQSTAPRDPSRAESIRSGRSEWRKVNRLGSSIVYLSCVFVALLLYLFIFTVIVDMMFFARQLPHTYLQQRKGQVGVLFHSSDVTQQLRTDQAELYRESRRLDDRITDMYKKVDQLTAGYDLLKSEMPDNIILPSIDGSGQALIPEGLWTAARAFTQATGEETREGHEFWQHFMANNAARLEAYLSTDNDSLLKKAVQRDVVVDRDTVIRMIQDRINQLGQTMPHIVRGNLTYALDQVILANMKETLTTVNFFSRGMGAQVNPHWTSPTLKTARDLVTRKMAALKNIWIPSIQDREAAGKNSPTQVLRSWQEENECWCSAKSESGRAQLGIQMHHKIYPSRLVVEHILKTATIDSSTAPKRIELWVQVEDGVQRNKLQMAFQEMVDSRPSQDTDKPDESIKQPGDTFVFVGSFDYDVDAPNYVQSLEPLVSLRGLEIPIEKTVVRVASNHGQDFTCLYRMRMLGELVEKVNTRDDA